MESKACSSSTTPIIGNKMNDKFSDKQKWVLVELSILFLILLVGDLWLDWANGTGNSHLIIEVFAGVISGAVTLAIWRRRVAPLVDALISSEHGRNHLQARLDTWKTSLAAYARDVRKSIDSQFDLWKLTVAEKETAFLLLKGLSIKDIAAVRHVSEKTVRQQSQGIYRKAGLKGRAELSAFFLEDILSGVHVLQDEAQAG
jgi:DNA-binding CsgD family transcriptional regulator